MTQRQRQREQQQGRRGRRRRRWAARGGLRGARRLLLRGGGRPRVALLAGGVLHQAVLVAGQRVLQVGVRQLLLRVEVQGLPPGQRQLCGTVTTT